MAAASWQAVMASLASGKARPRRRTLYAGLSSARLTVQKQSFYQRPGLTAERMIAAARLIMDALSPSEQVSS
jgi:hypothetical protein